MYLWVLEVDRLESRMTIEVCLREVANIDNLATPQSRFIRSGLIHCAHNSECTLLMSCR